MKKFLLFMFLVFVAACDNKEIALYEENSQEVNQAMVGEKMVIKLEANPTTGYKWHFEVANENNNLLKVLLEDYKPHPHKRGMVGVGGTAIYKFQALKKGRAIVIAKYYRPWEEFDPENDKEVRFFIDIR